MTYFNNRVAKCCVCALGVCFAASAGAEYWQYNYDGFGRVLAIDGPREDVTDISHYSYDPAGNLHTMVNASGDLWEWGNYSPRRKPGYLIDPNGATTRYTYSNRGKLLSSSYQPLAGTPELTAFEYDEVGDLVGVLFATGQRLVYEYDDARRLVAIADAMGNRIEFVLDLAGNKVEEVIRDAQGVVNKSLSHQFDELKRLISTTGAAGQTRLINYDSNGNPVSYTDGNGNTSLQSNDPLQRIELKLAPLGQSVELEYDASGQLSRFIDPKGVVTNYKYDGLGLLLSQSSPDSGSVNYEYDEAGNLISYTDALGELVTYSYDELNRVTTIDYTEDLLDSVFEYDAGSNGVGRLTAQHDGLSSIHLSYDSRGEVALQRVDQGSVAYQFEYAHNALAQLSELTYPSGARVEYNRNSIGEIISVNLLRQDRQTDLALAVTQLPFGPLEAMEFGNGISLSRFYDRDYRLLQQSHGTLLSADYTYDANSNITRQGAQEFGFDELDRLVTATGDYGDTSYTYDESGDRLSISVGRDEDQYEYDSGSHRLLRTSQWEYGYDEAGNQVSRLKRDGSGDGFVYRYDARNRMAEVVVSESNTTGKGKKMVTETTQSTTNYTYNTAGQRIEKNSAGFKTLYAYGVNGELLAELNGDGQSLREYIYLNGEPLAVIDYTQSPLDPESKISLLLDDGEQGTYADGVWSLIKSKRAGYQGDYLLSDDLGSSYRWNISGVEPGRHEVFSRWPGTRKHNTAAHYTIAHGAGQTESIQDQSRDGKQWVSLGVFEFSGDGSEYVELSDIGGSSAADAIKLESLGLTPPSEDGNIYYIHNDHLGTPKVITNANQDIVWSASYHPFGEVDLTTTQIANNLRFPGQYHDEETGLHYNYFRDYDPGLGRYIQSDPIGLAGGLNTYGYALQNPIIYTDPTGAIVPALLACAANPICAGAVRTGIGALIGGLSAAAGALSDPCFSGNFSGVIRSGALVGAASSFIPGAGALAGAAIRGGAAGFGGNTVGQYAANGGPSNFSFSQAAVSGVIGATALAAGNAV
ncbi:MAG: RHS repeat-associated protein, partial [Halieaceae bacterium]